MTTQTHHPGGLTVESWDDQDGRMVQFAWTDRALLIEGDVLAAIADIHCTASKREIGS